MAYIQKGNPFKQMSKSQMIGGPTQSEIDLATRLNKMRFEMGQIYPIISKEEVLSWHDYKPRDYSGRRSKEKNIKLALDKTAQTEQERLELYERDPSGHGKKAYEGRHTDVNKIRRLQKDIDFIRTAKKAGGETFDKLMSLPNKDLINFQNEVIRVAKPLVGEEFTLDWKKPIKSAETLSVISEMDLTGFKPYLEKADINTSDIKKIIIAQMNNMPDDDGDGIPNIFDGDTTLGRLRGNVLRSGVNTLIEMKLKSLK